MGQGGSPGWARRIGIAAAISAGLVLPAFALAQDFSFEFGTPGAPPPERLASAASSVAVDADGNPWVADFGANRIVKFDYDGAFVTEFSSFGKISVTAPTGIATDDAGFVYVAQGSAEPRIAKLDTGGRLIRTFLLEDKNGFEVNPHKLDVDDEGRIYVSDSLQTVNVYSPSGKYLDRIRLGSSSSVLDVTIAGKEVLITHTTGTVDTNGFRIYSPGLAVREAHSFVKVGFRELAADRDGTILVTDFKGAVHRYTRAGVHRGTLGSFGIESGQMNGPGAIDVDCRGNVYVVDQAARYDGPGGPRAGSKVLKFAQPGSEPPPCVARPLPAGSIDTQINDVEVTQAVQPLMTHTAGPILPPGQFAFDVPETRPRTRNYGKNQTGAATGEVQLKSNLKTVVRVYANLNSGPRGGIANIPATLEAKTSKGRRLGPIAPIAKPALVRVGDRTVDAFERTALAGVYTFDLPNEWTTEGPLELIARVNPARIGCERSCVKRSTFRLTGIPFGPPRRVPVVPIALNYHGKPPRADPGFAFRLAQRITPLLLEVPGYQAQAEVGDLLDAVSVTVESCFIGLFPCDEETYAAGTPEFREYAQGELMDRLEDAVEDANLDKCNLMPIGLIRGNPHLPGAMGGEFLARGFFPCATGYADVSRPMTAVAHELQHAFGRPHAGQNCPGTGDGDDQEGETWPPDDMGRFDGIGLNVGTRSPSARGPHDVIVPGANGHPNPLFDLMSYCANGDADSWISVRGWRNLANWRVSGASTGSQRPRVAATGKPARLLRVTAIELSGGALGITGVSPADAPEPSADPASPYVLEALDAANNVLASSKVDADELGDSTSKLIRGTVAAPPGTTQVFLRRGTEIGTRRVASPTAPKVTLRTPKAGSRIASARAVVGWKATDADGGNLTARVEYSANGGKSWRGIHVGPASDGRAAIPRAMLAASRDARVRVLVDDGFKEAVATSKRFTVAASPPLVRITDPAAKLTIAADSALQLRGEAFGTGGKSLAAKRLRWSDGRRKLGGGSARTVSGLSPGRHRITLEASEGGATGRATLAVTVKAVKPAFLLLDAPSKIGRKAKKVVLRVAGTVAAKLRSAGKTFAVSAKPRKVAIPVKGKGPAKLKLVLRAGKLKTSQKLVVPRS